MKNNKQKINFNDLMKETLKLKFGSCEKFQYCNYRIFFSTAVDLLVEKQPNAFDEIRDSISRNRHIEDDEIIECVSFYIDEPFYLQRIDENIYVYFYPEH